MNNFKIIALNVNSIVSIHRRLNLVNFLELHQPDVMLISETKLNSRHRIEFKNYEFIRQDRTNTTNGGGTAILIKRNIQFDHVKISMLQNVKDVENTIIKINLKNNKKLYLVSVYCSSHNSTEQTQQFEKEWTQIFEVLGLMNVDNYFILAGDINARHSNWGNANHNKRGIALNQWQTNKGFVYKAQMYKPNAPTYIPTGSYLDLAIADNRLNITSNNEGEIPTLHYESDHRAIQINCSEIQRSEQYLEEITNKRLIYQFDNTHWSLWTKKLRNIYCKFCKRNNITQNLVPINQNLSNDDIESYINIITGFIHQNIKMTQPKIRFKNNMECYTNRTIEQLYKHKSHIITEIKKLKRKGVVAIAQSSQIISLKAQIKRTNQLIIENIKLQMNEHWKNKIKSIQQGPKMFATIRSIWRSKNENHITKLEIDESEARNINIDWNNIPKSSANKYNSFNTQQNLDIIGHYIEKRTIPNSTSERTPHEAIIEYHADALKQEHEREVNNNVTKTIFNDANPANQTKPNVLTSLSSDNSYFITINELKHILECCNTKKSYGIDKIPNIVLKHLPEEIVADLCTIINNLLNNRSFPTSWKMARIFPILKRNKDSKDAQNYRPISLLSNLSKIYEIVIHNKIQSHIQNNNIMPDNQFGFRHGHSTIHAITRLTSDVCRNLNEKDMCTGAVMLDMAKAFESVWLDGLMFKLQKLKFSEDIIKILIDMLYNRQFITTTGTETSKNVYQLHNGLQQGTINASVLFNIYTADLISNEQLNSSNVQMIAYADDLVVYSAASRINQIKENIQSAISFITAFLKTWRIQINANKCETILFRKPYQFATGDTKKNWKSFKIKIGDEILEQKKSVKYLGINLDRFCYITEHINLQLIKAKKTILCNKKIFYSKYLSSTVKRICYQTLIRPIITYGCPVWYNCSASYMERLRKFERMCIRQCQGEWRKADTGYLHFISNQKQYNNFETDRIDIHIIKLIRNHLLRTTSNFINSFLFGPYYTDDRIIRSSIQRNKIPGPEAFIYLDKIGYIQGDDQIPIIYHVKRQPNEKGFDPAKFGNLEGFTRYSTAFNKTEEHKFTNQKLQYWWLN